MQEHVFELPTQGSTLSLEETGKAIGPIFAHDCFNHFHTHLSIDPQLSRDMQSIASEYNFSSPPGATHHPLDLGHSEIDRIFGSQSGFAFLDPTKEVNVRALSYHSQCARLVKDKLILLIPNGLKSAYPIYK